MTTVTLTEIKLLQKSKRLQLTFDNGERFELPCAFLRINSPSAEVRGHGLKPIQPIRGDETVNIVGIEPIGNYAVKLIFDDGHQSGLFNWNYLYELASFYRHRHE